MVEGPRTLSQAKLVLVLLPLQLPEVEGPCTLSQGKLVLVLLPLELPEIHQQIVVENQALSRSSKQALTLNKLATDTHPNQPLTSGRRHNKGPAKHQQPGLGVHRLVQHRRNFHQIPPNHREVRSEEVPTFLWTWQHQWASPVRMPRRRR